MLEGGCFCGFVRYRAEAEAYDESNCHCSVCRRTSAAAFVSWFSVPVERLFFTQGEPMSFRSSDHGTRTFCPRCGTPLTFSSERSSGEIDITTCSLDEPAAVPPKDHIHTSSRLPWVRLCDGLPEFSAERER